jgi:hypothetical protein
MANTFVANAFDWTRTIAQATKEARQEFETTLLKGDGLSKDQIVDMARDFKDRFQRALEAVKQGRHDPEPMFLSAMRNWARGKAIDLLLDKLAGKSIRPDYLEVFEQALRDEIISRVAEVERAWKSEDDQAAVAYRMEQRGAFGKAHPYVIALHEAVIKGERLRQDIFTDGVQAAEKWANKYEESMRRREEALEARIKLIEQQERENREHQLALRSLALWDDKNSFVNAVVNTGKNTVGCLLVWALLVGGILLAIYLAFPHH